MKKHSPLPASQLYSSCDPKTLGFESTAELDDVTEIVAQERALDALTFGIGIQRAGYNIFALGPSGTGKQTAVMRMLTERAQQHPAPSDWCYVNNFDQPHKPQVLRLPCGFGVKLSRDMDELIDELRHAIPAAFESDEYRDQIQKIEETFKERQDRALEEIRRESEKRGISLVRTPSGFALVPTKNGEALSPSEVDTLDDKEKRHFETEIEALQDQLRRVIRQLPQWRSESREKVKSLNREVAENAVSYYMNRLKQKYGALSQVVSYLNCVEQDILDNVDEFRGEQENMNAAALTLAGRQGSNFYRYEINVVVDNSDERGAPVVYEDHPTYLNIVGRVEHLSMMGALVTDFRLIKPGALHRANGGYLVLDALKLLQHPYAWEGLKRALRSDEIRIQSLEQMLSLASTVSLEPESMPLDVKVVLLGDRMLYYLLYQLDPEFAELFKVAADFENSVDRDNTNTESYAKLIATLARHHELIHLSCEAVARVIEQCSRVVDDAEKLSTHMRSVTDLLCESDYWANQRGHTKIEAVDVEKAIEARDKRSGRLRERSLEAIQRGIVFIDTEGSRLGTINGLTILSLGEIEFGLPSRITATVRLGEGDVIDIEREVELSGPIHSKGVYILSSFLGARYSASRPLSLSASLVFEQSYAEVDGDSASSTELYALLSALAEVPINQSLAVTGSINQHGDVQPIGGVNEKIEGFFDLCSARGLTGEHGVLIPASNVKHLMLRRDVVEAAAKGLFHIYPVAHIDDGIEILTGVEAGQRDEAGDYPENSINGKAEARLIRMAETRHEFATSQKTAEDDPAEQAEAGEGEESGEHPAEDPD